MKNMEKDNNKNASAPIHCGRKMKYVKVSASMREDSPIVDTIIKYVCGKCKHEEIIKRKHAPNMTPGLVETVASRDRTKPR